jgi:phospholipase/carboxylesterase
MNQDEPRLVESGEPFRRAGLLHRVLQPPGEGPHATVVMLHGRSGNEDVMWVFRRTVPKEWLLVAPRAIKEDPQGGYSWRLREKEEWPTLAQFDVPVGAVVDFIHALPDLYAADLDNLYLMGFSQGAAMAFAVAIHYPRLVKGVAALVGFLPMDCDDIAVVEPLADMPIFMAVGKEDERIPYERSVSCAHSLHLAGADLEYHEYETGHRLDRQGMRDLQQWWQARAADVQARRD